MLRPWTEVPVPDPLDIVLTEGFGGPATVDSICLDVRVDGLLDMDEITDWVSEPLDLLGIEITDSGCDAALLIEWSGARSSAAYETIGTCWTGWHLDGRLDLLVDGSVAGTVAADLDRPPPNAVGGCVSADRALPWEFWGLPITNMIIGAFGPHGALAVVAPIVPYPAAAPEDAEWRSSIGPAVEMLEDETQALDVLIGGLFHTDDRVTTLAQNMIDFHVPSPLATREPSVAILDAIPQLIAALDHLDQTGEGTSRLQTSLKDLLVREDPGQLVGTGFNLTCPAHWWLVWQDEWQRNAPCDTLDGF